MNLNFTSIDNEDVLKFEEGTKFCLLDKIAIPCKFIMSNLR